MESKRKLRVAIITDNFPPLGAFILNQITGLIDLGHTVDIYAQYDSKGIHSEIENYGLRNRTCYFEVPSLNRVERLHKAIRLFKDSFFKHPLFVLRSLDFLRYGRDAYRMVYFFYAAPLLQKRYRYDIVHCHFGPVGLQFVALRNILQVKYITTFYGWGIRLGKSVLDIYNPLFRKGDLFLVVCKYFKKKLIDFGACPEKVEVHRMGIALDKLNFTPRVKPNDNVVHILTIARLRWEKALQYAVKAIAKLVKEGNKSNLIYEIIGDGPERQALEELVVRLAIQGNVHFLGEKCREDAIKHLDNADIFLLSSIAEGTPTVLMEAQANGLPIVATNIAGIPEVVIDGRSGFLVSPEDSDALADRLDYLIEHPEIRKKFGKFGRKYIEAHYDIKKQNEELERIYLNLIQH